jgi:hypothetical protein
MPALARLSTSWYRILLLAAMYVAVYSNKYFDVLAATSLRERGLVHTIYPYLASPYAYTDVFGRHN